MLATAVKKRTLGEFDSKCSVNGFAPRKQFIDEGQAVRFSKSHLLGYIRSEFPEMCEEDFLKELAASPHDLLAFEAVLEKLQEERQRKKEKCRQTEGIEVSREKLAQNVLDSLCAAPAAAYQTLCDAFSTIEASKAATLKRLEVENYIFKKAFTIQKQMLERREAENKVAAERSEELEWQINDLKQTNLVLSTRLHHMQMNVDPLSPNRHVC